MIDWLWRKYLLPRTMERFDFRFAANVFQIYAKKITNICRKKKKVCGKFFLDLWQKFGKYLAQKLFFLYIIENFCECMCTHSWMVLKIALKFKIFAIGCAISNYLLIFIPRIISLRVYHIIKNQSNSSRRSNKPVNSQTSTIISLPDYIN